MIRKYDRTCLKCDCVKPPRSHHCSVCGRCVMLMDHHCPWMNNCIGARNMKAFILFNMYTVLAAAYASTRAIIELANCFNTNSNSSGSCDTFSTIVWRVVGILIVFVCMLFVCFTGCMFADQIRMRIEETSTIDKK